MPFIRPQRRREAARLIAAKIDVTTTVTQMSYFDHHSCVQAGFQSFHDFSRAEVFIAFFA
jgi:hypothetical protein